MTRLYKTKVNHTTFRRDITLINNTKVPHQIPYGCHDYKKSKTSSALYKIPKGGHDYKKTSK